MSRIALSLGLPPKTLGQEIIEALVEARSQPAIPPKLVQNATCQENILLGGEVNLLRIPAPILHEGDGGRYLNTYGIIVAQTPDKKWTNRSIARIMLLDKNRMKGIVSPNQHIGTVRQTWTDIGKPMPFALALGVEPFLPFVGGMPLPDYVSECNYAGAYFDEPIEVVQCKTVDLQVPATAEIVVEGYLSDTETDVEEPMGEYAGYMWDEEGSQKPVYHTTAMTYRNNPILPISVAGEPVEEDHTAWGIPNGAEIVYLLPSGGVSRYLRLESFRKC